MFLIEFDLATVLNTTTVPVNPQFLTTVKDGLRNCRYNICSCFHTLFATISQLNLTENSVQNMGRVLSIELSTKQQQAISDLILAIFGSSSTIALPIVANIRKLSYNCSNEEFLVETLQAEGELKIFPNIMTLSMVSLHVSVSSVASYPKLESLLLKGIFGFGSVTLDTYVEKNNPDVWTFGATFGEDTEINVIELISSAIGVDIPSEPFGSLLTITDLSVKGLVDIAANFEFLLVLQGTIHISTWYEENVCIIIHQSLGDVGRETPGLGFISRCVQARGIQLSTVISAISGFNISSFGFFGSFELPKFHIIYTTPNFVIDNHRLSLIGYSSLEFALEDLDFSGFRFIFDFYNARSKAYRPWVFYRKFCPCMFRPLSRNRDGFSLSDMVSTLSSALSLPNVELVNEDLNGIILRSMILDLELKTLSLAIEVQESITIFIDSFQISNLTISFEIALSRGISFNTFSLSGALLLGESTFDFSFLYNNGEYDLLACSEDFEAGFEGIANALGTRLDSSIAVSALILI